MAKKRNPYWIDDLLEKHECWSYAGRRRVHRVHHKEEVLRIVMPQSYPAIRWLKIDVVGEMLYAFVRRKEECESFDADLFLIARRENQRFLVHVCHSIFPWAVDYLSYAKRAKALEP